MKQQLKAIMPDPVWVAARETINWACFKTLPRHEFNSSHLRLSSSVVLHDVFTSETITKAWEQDHQVIVNLFGNDDNMGGVNPGDRRAIYYLIMALKPESVLEVGTHIGASTIHIARALKQLGQHGHMISADISDVNNSQTGAWKKLGMAKSPKEFIEELECGEFVDFCVGPCLEFMSGTEQSFDFIFLDGDHRATAVYQEVSAALSILNPGGSILLHDYYPNARPLYPDNNIISGPFNALERIKKESSTIDVMPLGELPWATKQGTNVTSLALVTKKG